MYLNCKFSKKESLGLSQGGLGLAYSFFSFSNNNNASLGLVDFSTLGEFSTITGITWIG